ncbi:glycosyltransferase family 2 protein [Butyrivibrio proteoclasticus]|uniref:glycosyltransferase family 2 protein n=1 Tax=Butyrivibrio proteoclasticus TaxID=43305 RepID=UPI0006860AC8|nr:glycosyltransferase family 2 protein [Butyrivibrio proteoclasticus]
MDKISVVILYTSEEQDVARSFESVIGGAGASVEEPGFNSGGNPSDDGSYELEVVLMTLAGNAALKDKASVIESKAPEQVVLVEAMDTCGDANVVENDSAGNKTGTADVKVGTNHGALMDIGVNYCSGDYILFMIAGDVLHEKLLGALNRTTSENPVDLVGYGITWAEKEFQDFNDDPFDEANQDTQVFVDDSPAEMWKRADYIWKNVDNSYLGYAYNREFLMASGISFATDLWDRDASAVTTLLFICGSVTKFRNHGYCKLMADATEEGKRISDNLTNQTAWYELMMSIPEIAANYKSLIEALFIKNYYLRSIDIARASGSSKALPLSVFKIMQFVCLKIAPKWIENEYLYGLSRFDLNMLNALYTEFDSDEDLWNVIGSDSLVSVIITTYNRSHILPRAIRNMLGQTYQNIELIVVDDASSDGTKEAVETIKDDRLRYIRNDNNIGVSHARNLGIEAARGTYIVYQDDDDLSRVDKLEKLLLTAERSPENVGLVYHETINHIKKAEKINDQKAIVIPARAMADVKKRGFIFPALLPWNFVACTSMMIKKSCFDKVGTFDESLFAFEDWDMTLRISREFDAEFIKEPLYDYFQSPNGLLFAEDEGHREKVVKALAAIDKKFEEDRKQYGIESIAR